jgi:hypothetical protein
LLVVALEWGVASTYPLLTLKKRPSIFAKYGTRLVFRGVYVLDQGRRDIDDACRFAGAFL